MTREDLIDKYRIYPITQHPDYQQDLAYDIDDVMYIINDFQSRTCENCIHYLGEGVGVYSCHRIDVWQPKTFSCSEFERKDK